MEREGVVTESRRGVRLYSDGDLDCKPKVCVKKFLFRKITINEYTPIYFPVFIRSLSYMSNHSVFFQFYF